MGPGTAQVFQDTRVGATGLFEGVGQDGQKLEGAVVVHLLGHDHDRAGRGGQPGGIDRQRTMGVADDVAQEARLCRSIGIGMAKMDQCSREAAGLIAGGAGDCAQGVEGPLRGGPLQGSRPAPDRDGAKFRGAYQPIRKLLRCLDSRPGRWALDQVPDSSAASAGEQAEFAIAHPPAQAGQHRLRVAGCQPLRLRHGGSFRRQNQGAAQVFLPGLGVVVEVLGADSQVVETGDEVADADAVVVLQRRACGDHPVVDEGAVAARRVLDEVVTVETHDLGMQAADRGMGDDQVTIGVAAQDETVSR